MIASAALRPAPIANITASRAMSFGSKIAEGDPDVIMNSREVQEIYLGVEPE